MQRTLVILIAAFAAVFALALAGCGDGPSDAGAPGAAEEPIVVSAAASLQTAFTAYGRSFGGGTGSGRDSSGDGSRDGDSEPRFSFAGSDALAAQIRQGARPDVFAAANTTLPEELFAAGLVERPTVFAGNRLVLAVPASGARVSSLGEVGRPGVKVAIGSEGVPVGAYTREVLARLPVAESRAILGNVRSQEPDVKGIIGKLTQGAVDAGFVYITDVTAAKGALKAVELPATLEPSAAYGVAVVKGAKHPEAAKAFVVGLLTGAGRQALAAAGFEPPPA